MTYRSEGYMRPEAASDREQLRMIGWGGEDALAPIGITDGVEVYQHPEILIASDPQLHRVVDEWGTGARRKVRSTDSNWRTVALLVMRAAYQRERGREIERIREGQA